MLSLTLKGRYTPPPTTVGVLFTVQCCHWHSKADIPLLHFQHYQRREWSLHCSMLSLTLKGRYNPSPHSTLSEDRVISSLFNVVIDTQRQIYPQSTVAEDRVISLLFNVVIETHRQIYPPLDLFHCSMLSLTLSDISPSFNTIRGQSDLFTVQCCHWHSKADIPLPTFNTIRGESDLFTVQCCHWHSKADITLPTFNTIRGQSDLFTVQCCHWHSKADITPVQHYQRTEWSLHCSMLSLRLKGRYNPTQPPPGQH